MAKVLSVANMNGHLQNQLTKSLERILEEAHLSGELKLSGRKLKDFPKTGGKYDLADTVVADLSKNRFWELPTEVLQFLYVEKLQLYHNTLRSLPESLGCLQSLKFLDLSRNQLSVLPSGICQLHSLEVLLVSNNKLMVLPEDIGSIRNLMELDASCNEITHLPRSMGQLKQLKSLDVRKNLLMELPLEITYLNLTLLDMSENRISTLPTELKQMTSLESLKLTDNPLISPPAIICKRGRVHVFKYLETQNTKTERKRGGTLEDVRKSQRKSEIRFTNGISSEIRNKRYTVDSGYSTSDGMDTKWAQDFQKFDCDNKLTKAKVNIPAVEQNGNHSSSESTPSTISPGNETTEEVEINNKINFTLDQAEAQRLIKIQANDKTAPIKQNSPQFEKNGESNGSTNGNATAEEKKSLEHIQTYREYKEALRQQRTQPDVYRPRVPGETSASQSPTSNENLKLDEELNNEININKKPIQKVPPSRNFSPQPVMNGNHTPSYVKPSSPVKGSSSTPNTRLVTATLGYTSTQGSKSKIGSPRPMKWSTDVPPEKLSFTMRREFEKAKEEAELIEQLRTHIEARLKMSLPEDLGPALMDGVVLCHLANHVKPRSVASIHVPSPAVPKLTMARCRRNVDNFLDACRKIGVEEGDLFTNEDVLNELRAGEILHTIQCLYAAAGLVEKPPPPPRLPSPTDNIVTVLCLTVFLTTIIVLIFFPPPN